jgi:hypothetical protein
MRAGDVMHRELRQVWHTVSVFSTLSGLVVILLLLQFEGHHISRGELPPIIGMFAAALVVTGGIVLLVFVYRQRSRDLRNQKTPFPVSVRYTPGTFLVGIGALTLLLSVLVYIGGQIDGEIEESYVIAAFLRTFGVGFVLTTIGLLLMYVPKTSKQTTAGSQALEAFGIGIAVLGTPFLFGGIAYSVDGQMDPYEILTGLSGIGLLAFGIALLIGAHQIRRRKQQETNKAFGPTIKHTLVWFLIAFTIFWIGLLAYAIEFAKQFN